MFFWASEVFQNLEIFNIEWFNSFKFALKRDKYGIEIDDMNKQLTSQRKVSKFFSPICLKIIISGK